MKIDRIETQTLNKKHSTDIAMLVEKIEFLREIQRLRNKWHITELDKLTSLFPNSKKLLNIENIILKNISDPEKQQNSIQEFNNDIDMLLKKFNRDKNYKIVVEYALSTGIVPDGVYSSCYFDVVTINEPAGLNNPENYKYVIVLSPRTEQQEVIKVYKEFKKYIKEKIKFHQPRISLNSETTKEFYEAMNCIVREKKLYKEKIREHKTPEELSHALVSYFKNTEEAQKYLLRIGDLDMNIPEHKELIEQYHKGNVNEYDDIDKHKTLKQFHRNRELFLISYKDILEGKSKDPLTASQVLKIWIQRCSLNGKIKPRDEGRVDCSCQYCTLFDINTIEKGIDSYIKFLEKINKRSLGF